jgi:hypothetical protein
MKPPKDGPQESDLDGSKMALLEKAVEFLKLLKESGCNVDITEMLNELTNQDGKPIPQEEKMADNNSQKNDTPFTETLVGKTVLNVGTTFLAAGIGSFVGNALSSSRSSAESGLDGVTVTTGPL